MQLQKQLATIGLLSLLGCGTNDSRSDQAGQNNTNGPQGSSTTDSDVKLLAEDEQLAGEAGGTLVDEAISASIEGSESKDGANSGFSLVDNDTKAKVTRYRACEADTTKGTAAVTVKRSAERTRTIGAFNRTGTVQLTQLMEKTRIWSKSGGTIECATDGKHADIRRQNLEGVNLAVTFEKSHSQSSTMQNTKKGTSFSSSRSVSSKGTRSITWTEVKTEGSNLLLTKSVQSEVSRTFDSTSKSGEKKSFTTTVKTDSNAPLVVLMERKISDDSLVSRTIVSGKKIATFKSGGRLETVFQNVKFLPESGCYAVSGKVEGSLFDKDAATATQTFVIDFSGETKVVTVKKADGSTSDVEYVAEGCDFDVEAMEERANLPVEKTSPADVTKPT